MAHSRFLGLPLFGAALSARRYNANRKHYLLAGDPSSFPFNLFGFRFCLGRVISHSEERTQAAGGERKSMEKWFWLLFWAQKEAKRARRVGARVEGCAAPPNRAMNVALHCKCEIIAIIFLLLRLRLPLCDLTIFEVFCVCGQIRDRGETPERGRATEIRFCPERCHFLPS